MREKRRTRRWSDQGSRRAARPAGAGRPQPLLELLDRVGGAEDLLRQRLLGQVARSSLPPQQAAKRFVSTHGILARCLSCWSLVTSISHGVAEHHSLVIFFVTLCVTIVILPSDCPCALIRPETSHRARPTAKKGNDDAQAHDTLRALHLILARHRRLRRYELSDATRKDTTMLKLTIRYAHYVLSSLATVGFSLN